MKKLTYQKQSEIFEKVVTKNGRLFLVRFVVVESAGRLRGKILSCEAIETLPAGACTENGFCLPVYASKNSAPVSRVPFTEIISPFFTLEFFMSQMTRAPSL